MKTTGQDVRQYEAQDFSFMENDPIYLKRKYPLLLGAVFRLSGELQLYAINAKVISILSLIPVPSSLEIQLPSK